MNQHYSRSLASPFTRVAWVDEAELSPTGKAVQRLLSPQSLFIRGMLAHTQQQSLSSLSVPLNQFPVS
jgi:hypothetical protein